MRLWYTPHFQDRFAKFPDFVKTKFRKQAGYLLRDFRYPSLHVKKFDEEENIWQARVDKNIRFYFQIKEDYYFLLDIRKHKD